MVGCGSITDALLGFCTTTVQKDDLKLVQAGASEKGQGSLDSPGNPSQRCSRPKTIGRMEHPDGLCS